MANALIKLKRILTVKRKFKIKLFQTRVRLKIFKTLSCTICFVVEVTHQQVKSTNASPIWAHIYGSEDDNSQLPLQIFQSLLHVHRPANLWEAHTVNIESTSKPLNEGPSSNVKLKYFYVLLYLWQLNRISYVLEIYI